MNSVSISQRYFIIKMKFLASGCTTVCKGGVICLDTCHVVPICYRAIFQNCSLKCCFLTWRRASENVYCYNKISNKKCVLNVFGVFVSLIFVKLMKRNLIFNQFSLSKSKTNLSFLGALTLIGTASYLTRVLTAPALERPMFSPPPSRGPFWAQQYLMLTLLYLFLLGTGGP